ncbi:MAG TPA: phytanoyl-CoA dioxygenase family protein [Acidimicrobiia bacterium]|nr:phytanoyl-CoA dioxygenase family protein [Acidimicrobiia bacterium]
MLLSKATLDAYRRDGFVVVDGLLSDAELDHYEQHVTAAVAHRTRADERALGDRSPYEQSFRQCINLWEDFPEVEPLTFHPRLAQAASELVGKDVMRLWHDQALYKEAGGRETDPHQDQPYWPMTETDTVTAWIPFRGSTLASGAMGYLPGSHLVGVRKFVNIFQADDAGVLMELPEIKAIVPMWVEVPRGSVAFHSGLTVHMAKPNTTGTDRAVHTVIYFADGSTRRNAAFHPSVDRDEIEVGAVIRGSCTPVVWPRADGDPVPRPAPIPEFVRQVAGHGTLPEERVR